METEPIIYHGLRGPTGHPPPLLDLTINAARPYAFVLGTATPVDTIHVQYILRHPCAGWFPHPLAQRRHDHPTEAAWSPACRGPVSRGSVHGSAPSFQPRMS